MLLTYSREKMLKKRGQSGLGWFSLLQGGITVSEALTASGPSTAVLYEPGIDPECSGLLIEELTENGVAVLGIITSEYDDAGLCGKYAITRVDESDMESVKDSDFVLLMSGNHGVRTMDKIMEIEARTNAEAVVFQSLVDSVCYMRDTVTRMFQVAFINGFEHVFMCCWPYVTKFKDAGVYESVSKKPFSPPEYGKNPERFRRLYGDLDEYSDEYIKEIFTERPVVTRGDWLLHADCAGKYVNIVSGMRFTADVPDTDEYGVYIVGGCMAWGIGTDDRHTIASCLQRHVNAHYGSARISRCAVHNLGVWGGDSKAGDGFMYRDAKRRKILFYIARGDLSHCGKHRKLHSYYEKFVSELGARCVDLTDVLEKTEKDEGTYIDLGHVNHRGYKAVARKLFDECLAPILNEDVAPNGDSLSEIDFLPWREKLARLDKMRCRLSEPFTANRGSVFLAVIGGPSAAEDERILLNDLRESGAGESALSGDNAPRVKILTPAELSGKEVNAVVTMPDGHAKVSGVPASAEAIPFEELVALVYDARVYYPRELSVFRGSGVLVCLAQWPGIRGGGGQNTRRPTTERTLIWGRFLRSGRVRNTAAAPFIFITMYRVFRALMPMKYFVSILLRAKKESRGTSTARAALSIFPAACALRRIPL